MERANFIWLGSCSVYTRLHGGFFKREREEMNERRIDKNQITSHTGKRYGQYHAKPSITNIK